jgi:hypothetical protein
VLFQPISISGVDQKEIDKLLVEDIAEGSVEVFLVACLHDIL